jgi:hypothetical protein
VLLPLLLLEAPCQLQQLQFQAVWMLMWAALLLRPSTAGQPSRSPKLTTTTTSSSSSSSSLMSHQQSSSSSSSSSLPTLPLATPLVAFHQHHLLGIPLHLLLLPQGEQRLLLLLP